MIDGTEILATPEPTIDQIREAFDKAEANFTSMVASVSPGDPSVLALLATAHKLAVNPGLPLTQFIPGDVAIWLARLYIAADRHVGNALLNANGQPMIWGN